ncbi:MAG: polar growth protein [Thelocarpon impressellum]|nr:MAG: polar growth protein [Thelocarpon impressellum]
MALRYQAEEPKKAAPGHILLVVRLATVNVARPPRARDPPSAHRKLADVSGSAADDFEARTTDELSLSKGDRIELIERDDDFGDGWYLGKHMLNGKTGLFPEVYTTSAPKGIAMLAGPTAANQKSLHLIGGGVVSKTTSNPTSPAVSNVASPSSPPSDAHSTRYVEAHETFGSDRSTPTPSVDSATLPHEPHTSSPSVAAATPPAQNSAQRSISMGRPAHGEESPVMNETLSVIQEHITDMSSPRHSRIAAQRHGANDSGSDYSSQMDPRLSYITGHDTDEEEESAHLEAEVMRWTPAQVAEYLSDVGVEDRHCRVFVEQEISGEVLLRMDQASIFIKDLELGPVGRRLRTWHKIKALQEEAKGAEPSRRNTLLDNVGGEGSQDDSSVSRSSTPGTVLPRIPSLISRSNSKQERRPDLHQSPKGTPARPELSPVPSSVNPDSPRRLSAASVREMNHSRRHSSIDSGVVASSRPSESGAADSLVLTPGGSHRKHPSFDRDWTLGSPSGPTNGQRASMGQRTSSGHRVSSAPRSAASGRASLGGHATAKSSEQIRPTRPPREGDAGRDELDRGYMSSGEFDKRKSRSLLKKRGSAGHLRNSSYTEEQRQRAATAHSRQSRYGSADSIRDPSLMAAVGASQSAAQGNLGRDAHGRVHSTGSGDFGRPRNRQSAMASPTVTKLDFVRPAVGFVEPFVVTENRNGNVTPPSQGPRNALANLQTQSLGNRPRVTGLRAISDAVTGSEKAGAKSPADTVASPTSEPSLQSPATTGASTPMTSKSMDVEPISAAKASPAAGTMSPTLGAVRRKSKKETSAYIRGLEKKTPAEQMEGCDYSGWMKKKSHKLLTTWKPRLFVLRGRRLSYYYSEDDEQEKGLIDISSHRVLAADTDRITGIHATLTGVSSSPTSPQNAQMPTIASTQAAAEPETKEAAAGGDSIFIFKLVPPRLGLSKAVNFTKPTVHYFAVDNVRQGRLWMAALMKATIDRDDSKPLTTTYSQKTVSLARARQMQAEALIGLDGVVNGALRDRTVPKSPASDKTGLARRDSRPDGDAAEDDSGVSGLEKHSEEMTKTNSADSSTNNAKVSIET